MLAVVAADFLADSEKAVRALVVLLLHTRVMPLWTNVLFHTPIKLAWPWWTPIGTTAAFLVCVSGPRGRTEEAAGIPVERA